MVDFREITAELGRGKNPVYFAFKEVNFVGEKEKKAQSVPVVVRIRAVVDVWKSQKADLSAAQCLVGHNVVRIAGKGDFWKSEHVGQVIDLECNVRVYQDELSFWANEIVQLAARDKSTGKAAN